MSKFRPQKIRTINRITIVIVSNSNRIRWNYIRCQKSGVKNERSDHVSQLLRLIVPASQVAHLCVLVWFLLQGWLPPSGIASLSVLSFLPFPHILLLPISTRIPQFRCITIPVFCYSAIPPFHYSAILLFRHSAISSFHYSEIPLVRHSASPLAVDKKNIRIGN